MRGGVHFINRFFYPDHSATSQILSGIAFELAEQGHDVHVTTSRQLYENAQADLPARESVRGVQVHRVSSTRYGRSGIFGRALDYFTFYLGAAVSLWRNVKPGDVVVAKTDPPLISLVAGPIARLRGAKYVNWLQDVFPEVATGINLGGAAGNLLFKPLRGLRNWTLKAADCNVVIGERMAGHLIAQGVRGDRIVVISNWSDPEVVFSVAHEANALRRDWGLADKLVVGYSGNLGRVHDVDTIVDAIELVALREATGEAPRDIAFVFVGGGAKRKVLEQAISDRGLSNVLLKPYQPEERLSESLSLADVHLVSLLPEIEGLVVPSKLYGIMAAGRPTVFIGAGDGEVARTLRRHRCGVSVGIGDATGLADAICDLAVDDRLRTAMGRAARATFLENHTRQISALSWHSTLTALASKRRPDEVSGAAEWCEADGAPVSGQPVIR